MRSKPQETSPWRVNSNGSAETAPPHALPLDTDVLVVGAGLTGLATAHKLKAAGKRVTVLDMADVGAGETGSSSAHVTWLWDAGFKTLRRRFGQEKASLAMQAHIEAVRGLAELASGIDCELSAVPAYVFATSDAQRKTLEEECQAIRALGGAASIEDKVPLSYATHGALKVQESLQLDPMALAVGLADKLVSEECRIVRGVRVLSVSEFSGGCHVRTEQGTVSAQQVVYATHTPINRFALHTKQAAYRTYTLALRSDAQVGPGLFMDLERPAYHYLRQHTARDGTRLLLLGGGDHKTGETPEKSPFDELEAYAQEKLGSFEVVHRWSGQVLEPVDGLPFIGLNPGDTRTYVATGYSGTGLSAAVLAAQLIADAITETENDYARVFSPSRFKPLAQLPLFVRENVDIPKHMILDRLKLHGTAKALKPEEGAIVRDGMLAWAVYRDADSTLHAFSPVCPHLGGYVQWNGQEKTWDCPCHGSRFSAAEGRVLNGPAVEDLRAREDHAPAKNIRDLDAPQAPCPVTQTSSER